MSITAIVYMLSNDAGMVTDLFATRKAAERCVHQYTGQHPEIHDTIAIADAAGHLIVDNVGAIFDVQHVDPDAGGGVTIHGRTFIDDPEGAHWVDGVTWSTLAEARFPVLDNPDLQATAAAAFAPTAAKDPQ